MIDKSEVLEWEWFLLVLVSLWEWFLLVTRVKS